MKKTIVTIAAFTVSANAQTFSAADPDMLSADWTLHQLNEAGTQTVPGSGGSIVIAQSTGGNGGSYLDFNKTWTNGTADGGSGVSAFWINTEAGFTFDPSGIDLQPWQTVELTFSIDRQNSPSGDAGSFFSLQDGATQFHGLSWAGASSSWTTEGGTDDATTTIDFGAGAGLVEFGIALTNTNSVNSLNYSVSNSRTHAYDNFEVTLNIVPEPSSTALLGLGALGLLGRRKR